MKTITCYGAVNSGKWCQEHYETASRDARVRASELRKLGYVVTVVSMGDQITPVGRVKMTMVDVRPGANHLDTFDLPSVRRERL